MSTRNTAEGVSFMMEATSCRRVVAYPPDSTLLQQVQAHMRTTGFQIQVDNVPALHDVFPSLNGTSFPETEPYPAARIAADLADHCMYLHSSGSTGLPKSVNFTWLRTLHNMRTSKSLYNCVKQWLSRIQCSDSVYGSSQEIVFGAMGLPSFHAIGLLLQLTYPLAMGRGVVVYTPQYPDPPILPHAQNMYEVAKMTRCNGIFAVPAFIQV